MVGGGCAKYIRHHGRLLGRPSQCPNTCFQEHPANPCSQDDAFALVVNLYTWVTMVGRCLAPLQTFTSFAQGMSIFFDDGGVGNNGQTGWWIAEEESFGESCLLWCPGGVIKGAEAEDMTSLPLSKPSPKFPETSPAQLILSQTILSSSTFQIDLVTPPSTIQAPYLGRSSGSLAGDWLAMAWLHELVRGGSSRAAERCRTG